MCTYVIAIGGNALEENKDNLNYILENISECIAAIVKEDSRVVIVHGNGPQIGNIVIQNQCAHGIIKESPIDECGAMTQAMIGYKLQNAIGNSLKKQGISRNIVTLLTRVVVNGEEARTLRPTKPIGPFFSQSEAELRAKNENVVYAEDSGRGYRRLVPSPVPIRIEEMDVIKKLISDDNIVIAGGGGGIPVVETPDGLTGIEAVIDKDYTASMLASELEADCLILLTGVEYVAVNYRKSNQFFLKSVDTSRLQEYVDEGQFAPGSMLPKVLAGKKFAESGKDRRTVIGTISKLKAIIEGESGTVIKSSRM